jgi:hypothetical protein
MNSFKFAFKAAQLSNQKQFLLKAENYFYNFSKKNFSSKSTIGAFIKPSTKIQSKQFFYLNHQKYLSVSFINLNKIQTEDASAASNQQQQQKKQQENKQKSPFLVLFDKENLWKVSIGVVIMMCASIVGWVLVTWGAPQYDENGFLLKDEYTDCKRLLNVQTYFKYEIF